MGWLKLKTLKETRSFYKGKLRDKGLTKKERNKYLGALNSIEKIIERKERSGEKRKHKKFIAYDYKAVFHNNKSYRGY
jgi:hypothetical protein